MEEIFLEVFSDIRVPFFALDTEKLCTALRSTSEKGVTTRFDIDLSLASDPEKKPALRGSMRGLIRKLDVPSSFCKLLAHSKPLVEEGLSKLLIDLISKKKFFSIFEVESRLVWEENSPWPSAFAPFLKQVLDLILLHQTLLESTRQTRAGLLAQASFAPENVQTLSEFPRQYPTHIHYAAASLGAWLGGSINVQYFAYYAAIRQITHSSLNTNYAQKIGYDLESAKELDASGLVVIPATLAGKLIQAQGGSGILGSIPVDEVNASNPPEKSFFEQPTEQPELPGLLVDKYYRAPFLARQLGRSDSFYGKHDVFRDHYQDFYRKLKPVSVVRCKHYCAPVVEVSDVDELRSYLAEIPNHNVGGIFFRGQPRFYPLKRERRVQQILFGTSCSVEPSLTTSASRQSNYDYDLMHFALKYFIGEKLYDRRRSLYRKWSEKSASADCRVDRAILALAQHYGLPSHGLDVTMSEDVAVWFATNLYETAGESSHARYSKLLPKAWPTERNEWPVIIVCQTVTHSISQSLQTCAELEDFGITAMRPAAQSARFFQGGHSDHQNRLAEAVVCIFRLRPNIYKTESEFDLLFPPPISDPAYQLMLDFAEDRRFGSHGQTFVNRFHV